MVRKTGVEAPVDAELKAVVTAAVDKVAAKMEGLRVADAITEIFTAIKRCNKYIDETEPWVLAKDEANKDRLSEVMYNLCDCIITAASLIEPFMPRTAKAISEQLNCPLRSFEMTPGFKTDGFKNYLATLSSDRLNGIIDGILALNEAISKDDSLGNGFCIGHSYFCNQSEFSLEWLENVIEYDIDPMLKEYWFDDTQKYEAHINVLRNLLK